MESALVLIFISFATGTVQLVLAYSGFSKLRDRRATARTFEQYGAVPSSAVPFVSRAVPLIELSLAVSLGIPASHQFASAAGALFLLVAAAVVARSLSMKQVPDDCGCFGDNAEASKPTWTTVARALGFAASLGALMLWPIPSAGLGWYVIGLAVVLVAAAGLQLSQETRHLMAMMTHDGARA